MACFLLLGPALRLTVPLGVMYFVDEVHSTSHKNLEVKSIPLLLVVHIVPSLSTKTRASGDRRTGRERPAGIPITRSWASAAIAAARMPRGSLWASIHVEYGSHVLHTSVSIVGDWL